MKPLKRWLYSFAILRGSMKKRVVGVVFLGTLLLYVSIRVHSSGSWFGRKPYYQHEIPVSHLTEATSPPREVPASKILLMTYGRSGSTFTSQVIQRDPRVFYSFEPLYNLVRRRLARTQNTASLFVQADQQTLLELDESSTELIEIFLYCGFEALNVSDINNFQLRNSEDSRLLWGCVQGPKAKWTPQEIVDCFLRARRTCLSRPIRMVKTIRFRGTAARKILAKHEDLKILYLVRDPRGTLTSQLRVFGSFKWGAVKNFSADYCQVFREDLAILGELVAKYPRRVMVLRYETLADNPLKVSEEFYSFLGLNFSAEVKTFVYNRTMAGQKPNNAYGTLRSNSTETANSWRKKISLEAAMVVDENCGDIYQALGYAPVHSEQDLKDMTHSLTKPVTFHGHRL